MGKAPNDVKMSALEREIDDLRLRTSELLTELERRVDGTVARAREGVRQLKTAGTGGTLALVVAGAWLLWSRHSEARRQRRRLARALLLGAAVTLLGKLVRSRRPHQLAIGPRTS